jgi:regulator of nucleoside diphosphate kinase
MKDVLIVPEHNFRLLTRLRLPEALKRELDRAIVVSTEAVPPDVVTMNSRVLYTDETAGARRLVSLAYPEDASAAEGRISVLATVGSALLGLSAGQAIDWDFPDGTRHRLRVEYVLHQPERSLGLAIGA